MKLPRINLGCLTAILLPPLLLMLVAQTGRQLYPWPKPVPGVSLEPHWPLLAEADVRPDNAFHYLRQLERDPGGTIADQGENDMERVFALGWAEGRTPAIEAFITAQVPNIELLCQAAAQPYAQVPTVTSYDTLLHYLGPTRQAVRALSLRVRRAVAAGDLASAGADARLMLRTRLLVRNGGHSINHLVGMVCEDMACRALRDAALAPDVPPAFLREMIAALDEHEHAVLAEPMGEWVRAERLVTASVVRDLYDPRGKLRFDMWPRPVAGAWPVLRWTLAPLFGSTPRRTQRHLDAMYSRIAEVTDEPYWSGRAKDPALYEPPGWDSARSLKLHRYDWFIADDPVGRLFTEVWLGGCRSATAKPHMALATLRGTRLFLAVRLHEREHDGRLPATLADLVPESLRELPDDNFAGPGKTFGYATTEDGSWRVWSCGIDRLDGDGQERQKQTNCSPGSYFGDIILATTDPAEARARFLATPPSSPYLAGPPYPAPLPAPAPTATPVCALRKDDTIVFAGDSITENPTGYVPIVETLLAERHPALELKVVNAGISSNRVSHLLARLDRDVLAHKPAVVFLYIGVNDVGGRAAAPNTPAADYRRGLETLLARLKPCGARVIVVTPAVFGEKTDGSNPSDRWLDGFAAISRDEAAQAGVACLNLRQAFLRALEERNPENRDRGILTYDGLHPSFAGNCLIARECLRQLGVEDAKGFADEFPRLEQLLNERGRGAPGL